MLQLHRSLPASLSVKCKRRWHGIGRVVPSAIEAHSVVAASSGNAAVVAEVVDGYIRAALGLAAVPELGNGLTVSK